MNILAIGNSFSDDATTYLHAIAAAGGVQMDTVSLCIGGCPLQLHWENAMNTQRAYGALVNGEETEGLVSIPETLVNGKFDAVTLQQGSILSGKPETYYPYIENLFHYIRAFCPGAEILIHQTWAYEDGYERLSAYENSSETMFERVQASYALAAEKLSALGGSNVRIIPCGAAMHAAGRDPVFASVCGDGNPYALYRDGFHASLVYGRYLLGAVWYETLTGKSILQNGFLPDGAEADKIALLKEYAHKTAR